MSYFDDASLVMIPSGYKTSKVYSVKPTDGSGDLTFSRSNDTATRVNSAGLIEKVRTNLILQSQDFTNAAWNKYQSSATGNSTIAPDGTTTADSLVENTANDIHIFSQSSTVVAGELTVSCYAKANTKSAAWLQIYDGSTFQSSGIFNLSTGTVSGGSGAIVSVGSGWYRISFTATVVAGSTLSYVGISNGTDKVYTGTSQSIFVWGFQTEQGVMTDYIATTSAAVSVGPVANVPRLDYLGSSCPRLLLEPQRTNLVTYSEQFNAADWGSAGTTITANQAVSPDGYTNADLAVNAASSNYIFQGIAGSISGTFTASIFVKKGTESSFAFGLVAGGFTGGMGVKFNFDTQTFSTPTNYANFTSISASYQSYGNGWYRLNLTGTTATSTTYFFVLGSLLESFAVNAYVYGAQLEASSYSTSYIPTLGASVTRGADIPSKTSISSLIGQTEGTLYAEFTRLNVGNAVVMFQLNDGTTNNRAQIEISSSGQILGVVLSGGGVTCLISGPTLTLGQTYKVAFTYKLNDFKLYVDGVLVGSDTSGAVPVSMSRLDVASELGTSYSGVSVAQFLNFQTALTATQLAELTTI